MDALLVELERDPGAARRRWAVAAATALFAVLIPFAWQKLKRHEVALCRGAEQKLATLWNGARRDAVHAAFTKTSVPYAEDAFRSAAAQLDRFTRAWVGMHTDACEATHVRGEQSAELLDLRMQCLTERREQAEATIELFSRADAKIVQRAVLAAQQLSDLEGCANQTALRSPVRPPADAATRAQVDALRPRLAQVRAMIGAGRYEEGLAAARTAADDAARVGYKPVLAEALLLRGDLERRKSDEKAAMQTLGEALAAAEAGRDDALAARVLTTLVGVAGFDAARYDQGFAFARQAEAFLERIGGDDRLLAHLLNNRANMLADQGHFDDALADYHKALALREKVLGPEDPDVAMSINNIGTVLVQKGDAAGALAAFQRSLAIREKVLGASHPEVAQSLQNIATALDSARRYDEELDYYRRALAIYEKTVGLEHPDVGSLHYNMGAALIGLRRFTDAAEAFRRSRAIREKALGADHPYVAESDCALGEALWDVHDYGAAMAAHRRALAVWQKALGADNVACGCALVGIGRVLIDTHRPAEAIEPLERALAMRIAAKIDPDFIAMAQFALARALDGAHRDRARALTLATQAREQYAKGGAQWQHERDEIDAFLARRR